MFPDAQQPLQRLVSGSETLAEDPNGDTRTPSDEEGAAHEPGVAPSADLVGAAGRSISAADIQRVQNLVERCLQLYMSQREVVAILHAHAQIEPGFTSLVWEKLVEQNGEFFSCYFARCRLIEQLLDCNSLLDQLAAARAPAEGLARALERDSLAASLATGPASLFLSRSSAFFASGDDGFEPCGGAGGFTCRSVSLCDLAAELAAHESAQAPEDDGAAEPGGLGMRVKHTFSLSDMSLFSVTEAMDDVDGRCC